MYTYDCMDLSCCKSHYREYVFGLACILHMCPNKYHHNLIFVDTVHGIYQVNIGYSVWTLQYIIVFINSILYLQNTGITNETNYIFYFIYSN